jgi:hypothetical protein
MHEWEYEDAATHAHILVECCDVESRHTQHHRRVHGGGETEAASRIAVLTLSAQAITSPELLPLQTSIALTYSEPPYGHNLCQAPAKILSASTPRTNQRLHTSHASCRSSCRRVWLRDAATATGNAQQHRDVRSDLRHNTFETVRTT